MPISVTKSPLLMRGVNCEGFAGREAEQGTLNGVKPGTNHMSVKGAIRPVTSTGAAWSPNADWSPTILTNLSSEQELLY